MKYILILLLAIVACSNDDDPHYDCGRAKDEAEAAASAYSHYVNTKPVGLTPSEEAEWQKGNQALRSMLIQAQTNYSRNCQ